MLSPEIARRIREIEIYTRRLVSGSLVGSTSSAHKGSGLDFDQLRDYQMGDDVRFIDWHSSARADRLLIKQYIEDRNRTVLIAVDCSASTQYGSGQRLKYDAMAEVAAVLALVGNYGKDQVGLLMFSDDIECYVPPARGNLHTRLLLEKMFTLAPRSQRTNIQRALDYLLQLKKRNALVFLISDFIGEYTKQSFHSIARLYDMIAVAVNDQFEQNIPALGFLKVKDSESSNYHMLDLRSKNSGSVNSFFKERQEEFKKICTSSGIDMVHLQPEACAVGGLVRLFRRRMRY